MNLAIIWIGIVTIGFFTIKIIGKILEIKNDD